MKTRFLIIATVFALALTSCKKEAEAPKAEETAAPKVEAKQNFNIQLDVTVEKDDSFALYFTEDNTVNFNDQKTVWAEIKGQPNSQKVNFDLSEEIIPTDIRMDFGIKKGADQGDVTLQNMKISYYGKSFEIKGSDFFKYFTPNDNIKSEIDNAKGTVKFPKGGATPFFYPQQALVDEIKKITQ